MPAGDVLKKAGFGAVVVVLLALGSAAFAADAQEKKQEDKPYPLSVCLVTDEKLGAMGEPHVIQYKDREIKFCCDHCEKDFHKEPQQFLAKLEKAAQSAATQPSTQPAEGKEKHERGQDHKH
jgi:hypothetical protein